MLNHRTFNQKKLSIMENNETGSNWTPPVGGQGAPKELPGAKSAYTLGLVGMILSFICCCFIHLVGLVLGIIGFMKSKEAIAAYEADPTSYDEAMYKKAKMARTFSIVAMIFGIIWLIWAIVNLAFHPFGNTYDYQEMMRRYK
jgi:hypothetical protein